MDTHDEVHAGYAKEHVTVGGSTTHAVVDGDNKATRKASGGLDVDTSSGLTKVSVAGEQHVSDDMVSVDKQMALSVDTSGTVVGEAGGKRQVSALEGDKTSTSWKVAGGSKGATLALGSGSEHVGLDGTKTVAERGVSGGYDVKKGLHGAAHGKHSTELVEGDQTVKTAHGWQGSASAEGVAISGDTSQSVAEGDTLDSQVARGKLAVGPKGVTGGFSGEQVHKDEVGSTSKTAALELGPKGKLTGNVGRKQVMSAVEGHEITSEQSLGLDATGTATAKLGRGATWKDDDGVEHGQSSSTDLKVGPDTLAVGHQQGWSKKDEHGDTTTTTAGGSLDVTKRQGSLSVGHKQVDKDGKVGKHFAAGAGAKLGEDGSLEQVDTSVSGGSGKLAASASAQWVGKIKGPYEADGAWWVEWISGGGASASAGMIVAQYV